MDIFEQLGSWIVNGVFGVAAGSRASDVAVYFVADVTKIFLLLSVMVFLISIVRTFITPQKVKKWLGGRKEGVGNVLAALLGVPTPFCSCSAVPLFIGFVEAGVPLGITFSFLVSAPLVNEVAAVLLLGLFGWKVTALYIGSGLAIAVLAGVFIGRLNLESEVEEFVRKVRSKKQDEKMMAFQERLDFAKAETIDIVKRVGPYIFLGVGIGALIHGLAPVGFLSDIAGRDNPLAVPVAVLIGIPLYSNAAGTIPIVQALMAKGMALGTALAFMMSVTALSLPEMIILRKVLKPKLLAIFIIILAVSFVAVGLLFNALAPAWAAG